MIEYRKKICNRPLFTIITATYNAEKYLESTIKSIQAQKFKSFEWIIIDSSSTDKTPEIIKKYRSLFHIYISEKDNGIYEAWNKGINKSNGDWITFIGAGDILLSSALQDYANLMTSTGNNLQYNFISSKAEIYHSDKIQKKIIGEKFSSAKMLKYMSVSHVAAMHHISLFEKYGLFSENLKSSSDYEFLLRCKNYIEPFFLNKITVKMLAGGMSRSYKALYETYSIHKKYHPSFIAKYYFIIALVKLFIRNNFPLL